MIWFPWLRFVPIYRHGRLTFFTLLFFYVVKKVKIIHWGIFIGTWPIFLERNVSKLSERNRPIFCCLIFAPLWRFFIILGFSSNYFFIFSNWRRLKLWLQSWRVFMTLVNNVIKLTEERQWGHLLLFWHDVWSCLLGQFYLWLFIWNGLLSKVFSPWKIGNLSLDWRWMGWQFFLLFLEVNRFEIFRDW